MLTHSVVVCPAVAVAVEWEAVGSAVAAAKWAGFAAAMQAADTGAMDTAGTGVMDMRATGAMGTAVDGVGAPPLSVVQH